MGRGGPGSCCSAASIGIVRIDLEAGFGDACGEPRCRRAISEQVDALAGNDLVAIAEQEASDNGVLVAMDEADPNIG
ncbi:hypothetical protein KWH85_24385, partial [Klebsiella aerogenes]